MAYGRTLHQIMTERPIRKAQTLADIMRDKPADRDEDGDDEIRELRRDIANWDAAIESVSKERWARKRAVKPPGESAILAADDAKLDTQHSKMITFRGELYARLGRLLQAREVERMNADDHGDREELATYRELGKALLAKRWEPGDDQLRAEVLRRTSYLEVKLAMRQRPQDAL